MIVPYGIQTYRRADLPRIRLTNLYAEKTPTSRTQTALLARPALETYADIGTGPIRGVFGQPGALDGVLFAVSGTELYAGNSALGTISGTARVSMASSSDQLLIANDAALYLTDGVTLVTVVFPDDAGASSVAYINGYFLAARTGSQRFYWSAVLDGASWDALDYASAERAPDNIVAIWVVSDQIWIFGQITTEVWVTTGDGDAPFQRVDGRLYDQGCLARDTIAKLDNSIFWVGHDFKVYRGDSQPLRVSDNGIEEAVQATDPNDLRAWAFPWQGNLFYVLRTAYGTFAYNVATQQWSEFASYGRDAWRAHIGAFVNGVVIAGDDEAGRLWQLSNTLLTDGDDPIERRFTVLLPDAMPVDNIVLDASSGAAEINLEPIVELRVSRDSGNTFSPARQASCGQQGQYRKRIAWRRVGFLDGDGAVLDIRMTDPTVWRVSSVGVNEPLAGRGRPS